MSYTVKNIYGKTNNRRIAVNVPGSKSITARALLIAAIAEGESVLHGMQFSDDCLTFLQCLIDLGINCKVNGTTVTVEGCGGKLNKKSAEINVGSAGTAARFLPAFLAFQDGEYKLNCSDQMKKRPISPLIKTLESLGASFTFIENPNSYPFIIKGTASPKTYAEVDINESSQFLSALLISAVCAEKPLNITANGKHGLDYVNMTASMMSSFGAKVKDNGGVYSVNGKYTARQYKIEPDVSAEIGRAHV